MCDDKIQSVLVIGNTFLCGKITVTVREFITTTLAEKIATALWNKPEWADSIVRFNYDNKIKSDCFNVIALNETGDVVGSIAFRETLIK